MNKYNLNFSSNCPIYGLPPLVQSVINEVSEARQCPRDYVTGTAIIAIATAIGSHAKVVTDYKNRLNLFVGLVGDSAQNKSTPAMDILKPIYSINKRRIQEYETKKALALAEAAQNPKKKGENPKLPDPEQLIMSDSTPEARIQVLKANPHGILQHCDELKSLFDNIGRYNKGGEASDLISIYNGMDTTINRKSETLTYVQSPWLSIFGTIQPGVFASAFSKTDYLDNGLLPRFMWFYPTKRVFRDFNDSREPDFEIMRKWGDLIERLYTGDICQGGDEDYRNRYHIKEDESRPEIHVRVDDKAQRIFNTFRNETGNYFQGYEATIFGKTHIFVYKLAALAALAHQAEKGYPIAPTIDRDTMTWGIQCAYYFRNTSLMVERDCRSLARKQKSDQGQVISMFLESFPNINQSELAKILGVSRQYINKNKVKAPIENPD